MNSRASILSPVPHGLGYLSGSSSGRDVTTSSPSFRRRPITSYMKFSDTTSYMPTCFKTLSHPTSRSLPLGHVSLDFNGKGLNKVPSYDFNKVGIGSLKNLPLHKDYSYLSAGQSQSAYVNNIRKYSPTIYTESRSSVFKDTDCRNVRSKSVANLDIATADLSTLKLYKYDSATASPRTSCSQDGVGVLGASRVSWRDKYKENDITHYGQHLTNSRYNVGDSVMQNQSEYLNCAPISSHDGHVDEQSSQSLSQSGTGNTISTGIASKYMYSGKVGLWNIGNTCFMNSMLQCLSNTKPLLEYTLKEDYMVDKNETSKLKGALINAYANLMTSFWKDKNSSYISPNNFKTQIQKFAPRFSGYQQQDAQEFLRYLLEGLHQEVNRVSDEPTHSKVNDNNCIRDSEKAVEYWNNYLRYDNSQIVDIFVGQLKSELKFHDCGHRSVTFDPFWDLSLPVPKQAVECDLVDCLQLFMKEEELDGDDSPTCTRCQTQKPCTKRFYIQKFPRILVLHMKRFSQERYSRKITTLVNFPTTSLDLTDFAAEIGQRPIYNLYAVSEHSGTTYGGHYTAKCQHPYTGEWNSFNDTQVSCCRANESVSSEAYVLFYKLAHDFQDC